MVNYIAIIDRDDGVFGAVFPDFPGCVSSGATLDEAIEGAREALALHAQGMEEDGEALPAPSGFEDIRSSGEFDVGNGVIVAAVPLIRRVGKAIRVGLSVDKGILEAIDDEARRRGMTRSAFMVGASVDQI